MNHSHEEIEEILEKYSDMVYRVAFSYTRHIETAEDVCQNVFLKYIEYNKEFESEEHRKAWLIKVALNECKRVYRSAYYRHTVPLEDIYEAKQEPEDTLFIEIMKLPLKYRKVLHLFYYEEYSAKEIGDILGIRENSVTSQLTRARKKLKKILEDGGFEYV